MSSCHAAMTPDSLGFCCVVYWGDLALLHLHLVCGRRAPRSSTAAVINLHLQTLHNSATVAAANNCAGLPSLVPAIRVLWAMA